MDLMASGSFRIDHVGFINMVGSGLAQEKGACAVGYKIFVEIELLLRIVLAGGRKPAGHTLQEKRPEAGRRLSAGCINLKALNIAKIPVKVLYVLTVVLADLPQGARWQMQHCRPGYSGPLIYMELQRSDSAIFSFSHSGFC